MMTDGRVAGQPLHHQDLDGRLVLAGIDPGRDLEGIGRRDIERPGTRPGLGRAEGHCPRAVRKGTPRSSQWCGARVARPRVKPTFVIEKSSAAITASVLAAPDPTLVLQKPANPAQSAFGLSGLALCRR